MRPTILPFAAALFAATHATPACAASLREGFTGSFLLTFFFFVAVVAVAQFVHWFLPLIRGRRAERLEAEEQREAVEH